ncbi:MAG TPA: hypothetical protein DC048_08195 [Planctomycetaceae bacterium]|nr:hypothetical protein [Planctomycetaceae bacterium]
MIVACPSCKMSLKMGPEHAGKTARCPGCGHRFVLPAEGAAAEPPAGQRSSDPVSQTAEPKQRSGWQEKDPANPHLGFSLLVGIGIMAAILLLGLVLRRTYVYTILFERGWVNFAETFVFGWGMSIIILKFVKLGHQRNALLLDVLPRKLGRDINRGNVGAFIDHIYKLPHRLRDSLMVNRIRKALELFEVRPSTGDVAHMLSTQSDIDSIRVAGSYSLIKVFIWAIPILGFLGTVIGVSAAVGGFTGTLENSSDIGALKEGLKSITSGLGTAFDTTLVALAMAMFLTFPVSGLQKYEGDILGQVDEYTNENLLRRLDDERDGGAARGLEGGRGEVARAIEAALAPHRAQLEAWTESVRSLGTDVARQVRQGWDDVNARLVEEHTRQAARVGEIDGLVTASREGLARVVADARAARQDAGEAMREAAVSVQAYTASLERGLAGLSAALEKLGEQRIIEVHHRPRWSLFGNGRKR